MNLDVFVQELSYEEITQQKAYDIAKLLSEYHPISNFIACTLFKILRICKKKKK